MCVAVAWRSANVERQSNLRPTSHAHVGAEESPPEGSTRYEANTESRCKEDIMSIACEHIMFFYVGCLLSHI